MKFVLMLLVVKDLLATTPWAVSFVAEFDDLPACQAAGDRMKGAMAKINAQANFGCMPKASEPPK